MAAARPGRCLRARSFRPVWRNAVASEFLDMDELLAELDRRLGGKGITGMPPTRETARCWCRPSWRRRRPANWPEALKLPGVKRLHFRRTDVERYIASIERMVAGDG